MMLQFATIWKCSRSRGERHSQSKSSCYACSNSTSMYTFPKRPRAISVPFMVPQSESMDSKHARKQVDSVQEKVESIRESIRILEMKEARVAPGPKVTIADVPIPEPKADEVLIKIVVSGSNPKDWKVPAWLNTNVNQGDDMAGIVEKVGADVYEFKPGDRVAGFHVMQAPGGSYAEYGVCPAHTVWHIPKNISFEEAAAIPLASLTAAVGLYSQSRLGLPQPWTPASEPLPLIVYGAASAVGAYAIHLAKRSNIHPLICVAGNSIDFVETLIDRSKGDSVIDYRKGDEAVVRDLREALNGRPAYHALDAVSEKGSYINLGKVLEPKGSKITFVLPVDSKHIPTGITPSQTMVGDVHKDENGKELGYVMTRYIARGLEHGWFKAQRQVVVPGGLDGIQEALSNLKAGKANAVKYVFRIGDTPGVSR